MRVLEAAQDRASGLITSGKITVGTPVKILPQALAATVTAIERDGANSDQAVAFQFVTLTLDKQHDLSPTSVICSAAQPVEIADQFEVYVTWKADQPMLAGRTYLFAAGAFELTGTVTNIKNRLQLSPQTGTDITIAATALRADQKGTATISLSQTIPFAPFSQDNNLGYLAISDPADGKVLGECKIKFALRRASNIHLQPLDIDRNTHARQKRQKPCILWLTGLSGSGKSSIANALELQLHMLGKHTFLLDGDNLRHGLNRDLGFTDADRVENIRRISEVAKLMADAGLIVITSFISPFVSERRMARDLMPKGEFFEIFIDAPLKVCEERDEKGLYAKARAGLIKNFTGIDSAYEPPENPEITIDSTRLSPDQAATVIIEIMKENNRLT